MVMFNTHINYDHDSITANFRDAFHRGSSFWLLPQWMSTNKMIFPKGLPIDNLQEFVDKNPVFFDKHLTGNPKLEKAEAVDSSLHQMQAAYFPHNVTLFNSNRSIDHDLYQCDTHLMDHIQIQVDEAQNLDVLLRIILRSLVKDIEKNKNPYYKELSPFFLSELKLQIKHNVVEKYWYRLAGSSVWLEEYGVHFMISRVLYSPKGIRNQPTISLTYAQLYDKDWNEMVNTRLVVPSNNMRKPDLEENIIPDPPSKKVQSSKSNRKDKNQFKVLDFPSFLPIPFWHDYDNTVGKYYGPEDPRIILVNNKLGYQEPLIVFNAYHRKLALFDDDLDDRLLMKIKFYRSMFICWPWQFQRGKENVDGMPDPEYDEHFYNRVTELQIKNLPRQTTQKNWTPLVSEMERRTHSSGSFVYDTHINFIYRWANLEMLRCNLESGVCGFTYRLNDRLAPRSSVGPLRGGTQLININNLIRSQLSEFNMETILPNNREIWLGFARAHLDRCGCGSVMYRPNLVIVVKDRVEIPPEVSFFGGEKPETMHRDFYKLSHVSSSISFDMPVLGWDLSNPRILCTGANILIPNGISSWNLKSLTADGNGGWTADDYMTISLSVGDFTVHKINIKGLLNEVFKLSDKTLFLPSVVQDDVLDMKKALSNLQIPDPINASDQCPFQGFNNDNVICAMQSSRDFCMDYGFEQVKLFSQNYNVYKDFDFIHNEYDELDKSEYELYEEEVEEERMRDMINNYQGGRFAGVAYDFDDHHAISGAELKSPKKLIDTSKPAAPLAPVDDGKPMDEVVTNLDLNRKPNDESGKMTSKTEDKQTKGTTKKKTNLKASEKYSDSKTKGKGTLKKPDPEVETKATKKDKGKKKAAPPKALEEKDDGKELSTKKAAPKKAAPKKAVPKKAAPKKAAPEKKTSSKKTPKKPAASDYEDKKAVKEVTKKKTSAKPTVPKKPAKSTAKKSDAKQPTKKVQKKKPTAKEAAKKKSSSKKN